MHYNHTYIDTSVCYWPHNNLASNCNKSISTWKHGHGQGTRI